MQTAVSPRDFRPLCRAAWYLSIAMLLLIPLQILVYVLVPPPATVAGFFALYRSQPFLGLLSLDFLYLFSNSIVIVLYLALAALLWEERPAIILPALVLGLVGLASYYPSNPSFEMLTLSARYALAAPSEQSIFLAAGEALLAGYTGTAFDVYYVLSTVCLLLFSYAILQSPRFHRRVGIVGLVSGFFMIVPSSAGTLGMVFSLLSLPPWIAFVALLLPYFRKASTAIEK